MADRLDLANNMSQSKTSELEDYVKRLGEHINLIHSKLNEINKKIKDAEDVLARLKDENTNNSDVISNLKENTVQKLEFDEFVGRLTESLRNLLPPIPEGSEEEKEEY